MSIDLLESIAALRNRLAPLGRTGTVIGLVPTMGALHEGHARLIELARRECEFVVVSVFVNPLQFDHKDDLERYPRSLQADLDLCARLGVDVVFSPQASEMYPAEPECTIDVGRLADHLCGRYRPGHFRGVATVVMKLFQIVQPHRTYFGEKDAQQLAIVRRLVNDFNVPVTVVAVPTVREADGVALSSRNQRLSPEERAQAPALYRALRTASNEIAAGNLDAGKVIERALADVPRNGALRVEYLEVVDPEDMRSVQHITRPVLVAGAMWVGNTRLIDNMICNPPANEDV